MDPCPFVRVLVGNLALKFPVASEVVHHPSSSPCYCEIKLKNFEPQIATVPLIPNDTEYTYQSHSQSASFTLTHSAMSKIAEKGVGSKKPCVKIDIYRDKKSTSCGVGYGKLLGRVLVPLDLDIGSESRATVFCNGWVSVGEKVKLHVSVRAEPDPRFVFKFGGEPECSPQVFQVQGNIKQPVFTCKFGFRSPSDRNFRSRSSLLERSNSRNWLTSLRTNKDHPAKERKGWSITIHDLSGSPVAAASMVTPFVPSAGSDRVSRSNPGAWLILRPGGGTWKPWGRLEAWLQKGRSAGLGYRFELLSDVTTSAATLASSILNTNKGGKFKIDITNRYNSPMHSRQSSGDYESECRSGSGYESGSGSWPYYVNGGFVMSSTVEGVGRCSKPEVEVGVEHVTCTEDAAVFVALAAAVDLSMDACRLFSHTLRKELRQGSQHFVV